MSGIEPVSRLLPQRDAGAHCLGGEVSPTTDLDALEKKNVSCPCPESNHNFSIIQRVA